MLLSQLTANLQNQYAAFQAQIEALQEQQRLIQAQLQRVGSVESKMESAAALVAEAIAEIRDVCPEELGAYRQVISGLFGDAPIAQIEPGTDSIEEIDPVAPLPNDGGDDSQEIEEPESIDVESLVIEDNSEVDEDVSLPEPSHPASKKSLHKQATSPLQWLATKRDIDTTGMKRHQIASALVGLVTQAELEEAIEQTSNVG